MSTKPESLPCIGEVSGTLRWRLGEIPVAHGKSARPEGVLVAGDAIRFRPVTVHIVPPADQAGLIRTVVEEIPWRGGVTLGIVSVVADECSMGYTVFGLPVLLKMQLRVETRSLGRFVQTTEPMGFTLQPEQSQLSGIDFVFLSGPA